VPAKARLAKLFVESAQSMKRHVLSIMRSLQKQTRVVQSCFPMKHPSYAAI
jgi:hypothetical protein